MYAASRYVAVDERYHLLDQKLKRIKDGTDHFIPCVKEYFEIYGD